MWIKSRWNLDKRTWTALLSYDLWFLYLQSSTKSVRGSALMLYSSWCSVWNWTVVVALTVSEAVAWHGVTSNGHRRRGGGCQRRIGEGGKEGPLTHLQMTPPAKSRNMLDTENDQSWTSFFWQNWQNNLDFQPFKKLERERLLLFCYFVCVTNNLII